MCYSRLIKQISLTNNVVWCRAIAIPSVWWRQRIKGSISGRKRDTNPLNYYTHKHTNLFINGLKQLLIIIFLFFPLFVCAWCVYWSNIENSFVIVWWVYDDKRPATTHNKTNALSKQSYCYCHVFYLYYFTELCVLVTRKTSVI